MKSSRNFPFSSDQEEHLAKLLNQQFAESTSPTGSTIDMPDKKNKKIKKAKGTIIQKKRWKELLKKEKAPPPVVSVQTINSNLDGSDFPVVQNPPIEMNSTTGITVVGSTMQSPPTLRAKMTPFERRTKIVGEILETEQFFIDQLSDLLDIYFAHLEGLIWDAEAPGINESGISTIFSGVPAIKRVNEVFIANLERKLDNWHETQTIGDLFIDLAPNLKNYKDFQNMYSKALANYTEYMEKEPKFAAIVRECDARVTTTRLEGCLVGPVQRIPRYKLFLEDLYKHTPDSHPDYELLNRAMNDIADVAEFIDNSLKEKQQRMALVELCGRSGASGILTQGRMLLNETSMELKAGSKLHVLLFNDILIPRPQSVLSATDEKKFLNSQHNQWPLELVWVKNISADGKYKLQLIGPVEEYIVRFVTEEELVAWMNTFSQALEKHAQIRGIDVSGDKRRGTFCFKNKTYYDGEWVSGKMHGEGVMQKYGNEYRGTFNSNLKSGYGIMLYHSQEQYTGEWEYDLPSGQGKMTYVTGHTYEGTWKEGRRWGQGLFRFANGDTYNGQWIDNFPCGFGLLQTRNGIRYEGEFQDGQFHGKGHLQLATGKEYDGMFVCGLREGQGNFIVTVNNSIVEHYEGNFQADMKHGYGKHRVVESGCETIYEGDFVEGLREGKGTMKYSDGALYTGYWKRGKRHGYGTIEYGDSSLRLKKYDGDWANDKKHGKGIAHFNDGNIYEGSFKFDMFHGNGTLQSYFSGMKIDGKWEKGVRVGAVKIYFKAVVGEDPKELAGTCNDPQVVSKEKKCSFLIPPPIPELQFSVLLN